MSSPVAIDIVVASVSFSGFAGSSALSLGFWVGLAVGFGSGLNVWEGGVWLHGVASWVSSNGRKFMSVFVFCVVDGGGGGIIISESSFRFFAGGEVVFISASLCFDRDVLENAVATDVDSRHLLIAFWLWSSSANIHSIVQFKHLCLVTVSNGHSDPLLQSNCSKRERERERGGDGSVDKTKNGNILLMPIRHILSPPRHPLRCPNNPYSSTLNAP